ncbi:cation transporter [Kitasatospora sp. SolWspMP-SS2h]|uniref:cation transporter n=1 Tax=Kitasatospora sp. SolWspMP-SS2h TaxID=1305729 RepID=UPI0011B94938|nr:cation transporter [Kitasatospora sp. SolWspMP-SS2h]
MSSTTVFAVEGVRCGHREQGVGAALPALPGAAAVTADAGAGRVTVTGDAAEHPAHGAVAMPAGSVPGAPGTPRRRAAAARRRRRPGPAGRFRTHGRARRIIRKRTGRPPGTRRLLSMAVSGCPSRVNAPVSCGSCA